MAKTKVSELEETTLTSNQTLYVIDTDGISKKALTDGIANFFPTSTGGGTPLVDLSSNQEITFGNGNVVHWYKNDGSYQSTFDANCIAEFKRDYLLSFPVKRDSDTPAITDISLYIGLTDAEVTTCQANGYKANSQCFRIRLQPYQTGFLATDGFGIYVKSGWKFAIGGEGPSKFYLQKVKWY